MATKKESAIILMVGRSLINLLIGPEKTIMINMEIRTAKTIIISGLPCVSWAISLVMPIAEMTESKLKMKSTKTICVTAAEKVPYTLALASCSRPLTLAFISPTDL